MNVGAGRTQNGLGGEGVRGNPYTPAVTEIEEKEKRSTYGPC